MINSFLRLSIFTTLAIGSSVLHADDTDKDLEAAKARALEIEIADAGYQCYRSIRSWLNDMDAYAFDSNEISWKSKVSKNKKIITLTAENAVRVKRSYAFEYQPREATCIFHIPSSEIISMTLSAPDVPDEETQ